jgi:hypothetical protein
MTLIVDLPDEQTAALAAKARAHGLSAEQTPGRCWNMTSCRGGFRSHGKAPNKRLSEDEISAEIDAVRKTRRESRARYWGFDSTMCQRKQHLCSVATFGWIREWDQGQRLEVRPLFSVMPGVWL